MSPTVSTVINAPPSHATYDVLERIDRVGRHLTEQIEIVGEDHRQLAYRLHQLLRRKDRLNRIRARVTAIR